MKLRYYQQEAINSLYQYFDGNSGNPVIAMPTGTGKSLCIADFIKSVFRYPNQHVLMLTHVKELIEQNTKTLVNWWPTAPLGIYSAGLNRRELGYPITFATIASVRKRAAALGHIDLVIIDECHLVSTKDTTMYRRLITDLKAINPLLKVIGLSATPYRLGQGYITDGGLFTDICYNITGLGAFNRLIEEGYLAQLIPRHTDLQLDLSEVHIRGGEYVPSELQHAVDKDAITALALHEMVALGQQRKHWLIFASGVTHAEHVADGLVKHGIRAVAVHSKMSDHTRDSRILGFISGYYQAIVNNNILTTGFDFPEIDMIGMLRPTSSPGLWVQMLGRGTRPADEKEDCLVLDFAGNTARLGPVNDPIIPNRKGKKGIGGAPVRLCEKCNTYNHISVRICTNCGYEFPIATKLHSVASTAELIKSNLPKIEPFKVDRVTYAIHNKPGRPSSLKVSYFCGLRLFNEWVCLEHAGYALRKAKAWWHDRSSLPVPETVDNAMEHINVLKIPDTIDVWINKKYPEIRKCTFPDEPEKANG